MKVTINGVTYEGTEDEIRRIVENPPNYGGDRINYPYPINPGPYVTPTYPEWPPLAPSYPTNIEVTWGGFSEKLGWFSQGDLLRILNEPGFGDI